MLIVECDPRRIEEVRRNWPFLRDRRIDAYTGILSRVIGLKATAARARRFPHARRVGAARGHLDRVAAQSRRLARPLCADPVGVRRDRPQAEPRGTRAHPGGRPRASGAGPRACCGSAARISRRSSSSRARRTASGRATTVRSSCAIARAKSPSPMALQRLGEIRRLEAGCARAGVRDAAPEAAVVHARNGARRRQHRRQRRGIAADHRGVPAQSGAGAQSRTGRVARSSARCATISAPIACSGSRTASRATTRTATWTTWRGSPVRTRSSRPGSRIAPTPTTSRWRRTEAILQGRGPARGEAADAAAARRSTASGCPPATPISTSRTDWCWFRRSTIPTTASRLNTLARLFPDREVCGINCTELILGSGHAALHDAAAAGLRAFGKGSAADEQDERRLKKS